MIVRIVGIPIASSNEIFACGYFLSTVFVEAGVKGVKILAVHFICQKPKCLTWAIIL